MRRSRLWCSGLGERRRDPGASVLGAPESRELRQSRKPDMTTDPTSRAIITASEKCERACQAVCGWIYRTSFAAHRLFLCCLLYSHSHFSPRISATRPGSSPTVSPPPPDLARSRSMLTNRSSLDDKSVHEVRSALQARIARSRSAHGRTPTSPWERSKSYCPRACANTSGPPKSPSGPISRA